jgi:hypothetical protein
MDWIEARGRGMHRYDYPGKQQWRFAVSRKTGVHHYILELEVSDLNTHATASGVLAFGH